jgi:superfamily II DNA or RNA helicase
MTSDIGLLLMRAFPNAKDNLLIWDHQPITINQLGTQMYLDPDTHRFSIISPWGTGKTKMQLDVMRVLIDAGYTNMVYVTRRANISSGQFIREARDADLRAMFSTYVNGVITGNLRHTDVTVTTYNSFPKVLKDMSKIGTRTPFIFLDEAHHTLYKRKWLLNQKQLRQSIQTAWTATKGKRISLSHHGFKEVWQLENSTAIARGILCPVRIERYVTRLNDALQKQMDEIELSGGVVDKKFTQLINNDSLTQQATMQIALSKCVKRDVYGNIISLEPTIVLTDTAEQAETILRELQSQLPTYLQNQVEAVLSKYPHEHNAQVMKWARNDHGNQSIQWLIGVDMLSEEMICSI